MSVQIAGMGWVTPLGGGVTEVWEALRRGEAAKPEAIAQAEGGRSYQGFRVPAGALQDLPVHPRLRRASAISKFAAAAGTAALRDARTSLGEIDPARLALIFAISNGGVIYTKRFYHDIVVSGAGAASPLLFPETVFNAPASHLAALLGVTGPTYTLVGDGSVGLSALNMAEDLMRNDALDYCLVVGAEEIDWLLCDAYAKWRLLRPEPPIEPFAAAARGMILGEGAGAVLLARQGDIQIRATHAGGFYRDRRQLAPVLKKVLGEIDAGAASFVVANANGTFIDTAQSAVLQKMIPQALAYTAAPALGEGVGASGLWQVVVAAQALRTQTVPPLLPASSRLPSLSKNGPPGEEAVVFTCGLNQQVSALALTTQRPGR